MCWKKFVNAAAHYPAQVLVMGGDLTGKALVPIVGPGRRHLLGGGDRRAPRGARTAEELDQLQSAIATNGMYQLIVDPDEAGQWAFNDTAVRVLRRRLQNNLQLHVLEKAVRILSVPSVCWPSRWLNVRHFIWLRSQDAQEGFRRHRSRAHFDVIRLLQYASALCPKRLQAKNKLLESQRIGLGLVHNFGVRR